MGANALLVVPVGQGSAPAGTPFQAILIGPVVTGEPPVEPARQAEPAGAGCGHGHSHAHGGGCGHDHGGLGHSHGHSHGHDCGHAHAHGGAGGEGTTGPRQHRAAVAFVDQQQVSLCAGSGCLKASTVNGMPQTTLPRLRGVEVTEFVVWWIRPLRLASLRHRKLRRPCGPRRTMRSSKRRCCGGATMTRASHRSRWCLLLAAWASV
jgi:hypothetical protein